MQAYTFNDGRIESGILVTKGLYSNSTIIRKEIPSIVVGVRGSYQGTWLESQYLEVELTSYEMWRDIDFDKRFKVMFCDVVDSQLDADIFSSFSRKKIVATEKPDDSRRAVCAFRGWGNGSYGHNYPTGDFSGVEKYRGSKDIWCERPTFLKFPGNVIAQGSVSVDNRISRDMGPNDSTKMVAIIEPGSIIVVPTATSMSLPQYNVWAWNGKEFCLIRSE